MENGGVLGVQEYLQNVDIFFSEPDHFHTFQLVVVLIPIQTLQGITFPSSSSIHCMRIYHR